MVRNLARLILISIFSVSCTDGKPELSDLADSNLIINTPTLAVTVNQKTIQADPTSYGTSVEFDVIFSSAIDTATFDYNDITNSGTATISPSSWTITNNGDDRNFSLMATGVPEGTLIPSIAANNVTIQGGTLQNSISTSTDNSVTIDQTGPTASLYLGPSQQSSTNSANISFVAIFSEPVSGLDSADISLSGGMTLSGTWSISPASGTSINISGAVDSSPSDGSVIISIPTSSATDMAGNSNVGSGSSPSITIDRTSPTVLSVTSPETDGTYSVANSLNIDVILSESVTVSGGVPTLSLNTGGTAYFLSVTSSTIMRFGYIVGATHVNSDLDYSSSAALSLNSATVRDGVSNDATLTLPTPGTTYSLAGQKNLDIIGDPVPIVTSLSCFTNARAGSSYGCNASASNISDPGNSATWSLAGNTCTWLSIGSSTGVISGTVPSTVNSSICSFSVKVNDGTNDSALRHTFILIEGDTGITQVASGPQHSCRVEAGWVHCWGRGDGYQIGNGSNVSQSAPQQALVGVGSPLGMMSHVSLGSDFSCGLNVVGSVKCWGSGTSGQIGNGSNTTQPYASTTVTGLSNVIKIAAGYQHTCAILSTNGNVKCWGNGSSGALGNGTSTIQSTPVFVTLQSDSSDLSSVISLASGGSSASTSFSCAVRSEGSVYCWGSGSSGQLGQNNTASYNRAVPVLGFGPGAQLAINVVAGGTSACALTQHGNIMCWGNNSTGNLGRGDTTAIGTSSTAPNRMQDIMAVDLGTGRTAKFIASGIGHVCAVLDNDTLKCWGEGTYGKLGSGNVANIGDGPSEMGDNLAAVSQGTGVTALIPSAGQNHTCVLMKATSPAAHQKVKCFGDDSSIYRQLGLGGSTPFGGVGDSGAEMGDNLRETPRCAYAIQNYDPANVHSGKMVACDYYTTNSWAVASSNCAVGYHMCSMAEYRDFRTGFPLVDGWLSTVGMSATWSVSLDGSSWVSLTNPSTEAPFVTTLGTPYWCSYTDPGTFGASDIQHCTNRTKSNSHSITYCCAD